MKKALSLIALVMLLFMASPSFSQKGIYFGLGGSMLNTWTTNQNNYGLNFEMDYDITIGGAGNINIGYNFNDNLGLKLEAGYAVLGQKYSDNYQDTTYTRRVFMNYVQVPLMFKYRSNGEVVKFYVMAGPQFNILMSAKQDYYKHEVVFTDSTFNPITEKPIKIGESTITDRYESLDIMARIDFGVDIQLTENLFLNAGISTAYGLLDINAEDWRIPDHSSNEYNPSHNLYGGINVGISYVIPMGKK